MNAVAAMRRPGDAEPIKRLKREMSVALGEEDYATAARIRDHPYVQLYLSINEALRKKDIEVSSQRSACKPNIHMHASPAPVAPCLQWATGECILDSNQRLGTMADASPYIMQIGRGLAHAEHLTLLKLLCAGSAGAVGGAHESHGRSEWRAFGSGVPKCRKVVVLIASAQSCGAW